jgi:hypothetical protein
MGGITSEIVAVRRSLSPLVRGAGTTNGTGIDILGSDYGAALITTGLITDGSHVLSLEESDVVGSGYTAIPAGRLTITAPTITSTDSNKQWLIGFFCSKLFVRAVIVTTGGTSANTIGVSLLFTQVDVPVSNPQT